MPPVRRPYCNLESGELYLPPQLADLVGSLSQVSTFYYGMLGAVATVLLGALLSLIFAPPPPHKVVGLSHAAPAHGPGSPEPGSTAPAG